MKATSSRRQLIVLVLLGLALTGAAMRQWADKPSLTRDIGTLLLVLWLPIIGNVVAFVITRVQSARQRRRAIGFAPDAAFTPHLLVDVTPVDSSTVAVATLSNDECNFTLVIGQEGFTVRAAVPLVQWLAADAAQSLALQLLRPALALPRLPVGAAFNVLAGRAVVGTGRVLQMCD
jgi:hypothetical protein